ncbi:MAG: hypothetical protein R6X15_09680 [Pseudomonadota bacterium]
MIYLFDGLQRVIITTVMAVDATVIKAVDTARFGKITIFQNNNFKDDMLTLLGKVRRGSGRVVAM